MRELIIRSLIGAQWLMNYEGSDEDFEIYLYGLSDEYLLEVYDKIRDNARDASKALDELGRVVRY